MTPASSPAAAAVPSDSRLLGQRLLARGAIRPADLERALELQQGMGGRLGSLLVRIGALSEEQLLDALAEQSGLAIVGREVALPAAGEWTSPEGFPSQDWMLDQQILLWEDADGQAWCAGRDPLAPALQAKDFAGLEKGVARFQQMSQTLKYAQVPVVAAVSGMALGGGCEVVMHSSRAVAALESYIGLVEAGVGLIPAGGGCKEFALRASEAAARIARVLHNDPATGVMRHADAGYDIAVECAVEEGLNLPMIAATQEKR